MTRVNHDAFARGSYDRKSHGPGECAWCGQIRKVVYSYVWKPDDATWSPEHAHKNNKSFCNLDCFKSYYM